MGDFSSKFYKSANRPAARYASGSTVYEECLQNGRYIGLYWSSDGQVPREYVVEQTPSQPCDTVWRRLNSFGLEVDGQLLDSRWEYEGDTTRAGTRDTSESVVMLKHESRPVSVQVVTRFDGSPFLVRYLEITNTGDRPAALSYVQPFSGRLWDNIWQHLKLFNMPFDPQDTALFSVGHYRVAEHDSCLAGHEGNFVWRDIEDEYFVTSRPERRPFGGPFYILRNNLTGECFYVSLEWSAGFELRLWYDKQNCSLCMGIGPAGPSPLRVLAPGETVVTPAVHIGPVHADADSAVKSWYSHLRTSVLPKRPEGKEMYTIAARVVGEPGDWILREIDTAHEMGAEAFMVDAGWYGKDSDLWANRGDWFENDRLPAGGLTAIREYIHDKGMLFGLWMEPESVGHGSKVYAEHPDWRVTYDGENEESIGDEGLLNMAKPEVAEFVRSSVFDLIEGKKLDFFKLDYNTCVVEGGRYDIHGYFENQAWRHLDSLYAIFDEALERFPGTAFENCASGGGRNDLGMLSRFHYASQSDFGFFPYSIRSINGLTLFLPPETLTYYHNHNEFAGKMTDIETHLRVTLFCPPIFVGYGGQNAERNSVYFQKTREYTELFKTFCKPVITRATVFHHTPYIGVTAPAEWCVLEYSSENRERGYTGLFRLGRDPAYDEYRLYLRGVDPSGTYDVTLHNIGAHIRAPGAELMTNGISVRLSVVHSSELILYDKVSDL